MPLTVTEYHLNLQNNTYSEALSETVTLTESLTAVYHTFVALTETITTVESLASLYKAQQALSETVSLAEALVVILNNEIMLSESVPLSESLASHYVTTAGLAETVTLTELLTANLARIVQLLETITGPIEGFTTRFVGHSNLNEIIDITEDLSGSQHFHYFLNETVPALLEQITAALFKVGQAVHVSSLRAGDVIYMTMKQPYALRAQGLSATETNLSIIKAGRSPGILGRSFYAIVAKNVPDAKLMELRVPDARTLNRSDLPTMSFFRLEMPYDIFLRLQVYRSTTSVGPETLLLLLQRNRQIGQMGSMVPVFIPSSPVLIP